MKKVQILIVTFLIGSVALFSFKTSKNVTRYGGSASVRINIVQIITHSGERKTLSSPTINATEYCNNSTSADAKSSLESSIEREATSKKNAVSFKPGVTNEWEYDGEINYRITTCN